MKSLKQTEVVCRDVVELVHEYLEDALSARERAAFEQHLHACPWCLTYLDQIRATARGVRELAAPARTETSLPVAVETALVNLFRARQKP